MKIKSLNRRIALNTVTNFAGYLSNMVIAFFLTPFIIGQVGKENYGIWLVILAFFGYATMLEFGLQESVTKLVSKYESLGENGRINEIFTASVLFVGFLSVVAMACFAFIFPHLLGGFIPEAEKLPVARLLLFIVGFDAVLTLNKYAIAGMIYGFQLYYVKNLVDTCLSVLNPLLVFFLIQWGFGVYSLAISTASVTLATFLVYVLICKRHFGSLRLIPRNLRWSTLKEIFSIGMKIFTSATIQRASSHTQPLIIAWHLSPAFNTLYSIPSRLVHYGTEMLYVLTTGYMPVFSELSSKGDFEKIREVYFKYTRYILILYCPLPVGLLAYGTPFISFWMGPEYAEEGKYVVLFLTLSLILNSLQPLLRRMLVGIGRLNVLVVFPAVMTFFQVIGSFFMVKYFGISGMAATAFASSIISQSFWWNYAASHFGLSVVEYIIKGQGKTLLTLLMFYALVEALKWAYPPGGYLDILWQMGVGALVYFLLAYRLLLKEDERLSISSYLVRAVAAK